MERKVWHAVDVKDVYGALETRPEGLTGEEGRTRLERYGLNELKEAKRATALDLFLNQFKDVFVIMLIAATAVAYYVDYVKGETPVDAATIAAIVVLNAVVGFVQEYRSEKAIEAMRRLTAPRARVLRDGREVLIPAKELVPGEVLLLEAGDRVGADARLTEVVDLRTDEAVLTGESTPVEKRLGVHVEQTPVGDRRNMVFMATHVTYGRGRAVATSTGMSTEFGRIAEMVEAIEEEATPLKLKLERFAKRLGVLVIVACALIFVLELISPGRPGELLDSFLVAISLAVSAVPEGLPAVVTVTLALGARELAKRNAIIRRLSSAETLGATTVICSDKTGTLTKGEMTVRRIYIGGANFDVSGVGYEAKGDFLRNNGAVDVDGEADLRLLLTGAALCTNASYDGKGIIGDPTEGALAVAAAKAGLVKEALEKEYPRLHEVPFSSERKRMTTVHRTPDGRTVAFVKGAPEIVLDRCSHIRKNGKTSKLGDKARKEILKVNEEMANGALRVLGVAYRELEALEPGDIHAAEDEIESGLVFLGLAGMIDPPREEAREANERCVEAGIKTVMITGDHRLTAVAVAKEIGMIREGGLALTGEELDRLSDDEFDRTVEGVAVYARVSPQHKIRIVDALRRRGHIVAMTGDGVNDAPALKQADIGVAMGITGTDVTKEASDMVLADDNFATIVKAVEGGRAIYDNIRKFSFFLLRSNFDELAIVGTFAILGLEIPLTAGMILWINLMTDGPPAIALSQDPPDRDIMRRPPRNPGEGILHGRLASILVTMATQFLGTAVLFYIAHYIWGRPVNEARTMAFIQATMQELTVVWNCRSDTRNAFRVGFTNNKYLLLAVIFSAALTLLLPFFDMLFGVSLFNTVPLDLADWALVLPISMAGFLMMPELLYNRKILRWR